MKLREEIQKEIRMFLADYHDKILEANQAEISDKDYKDYEEIVNHAEDECCSELVHSITKHIVEMLPKEKEEYTDDCYKTCGHYSHTYNKKRWWEIPENIGYNQCLQDLKERIGDDNI